MFARKSALGGLALAAILATTGCSTVRPNLADVPEKESLAVSAAFDDAAAAETEVQLDWSPESMFVLFPRSGDKSQLPTFQVKNLSFNELGVADSLRMLAAQGGLTVRIEGGALGSERYGPFAVDNLSGSFGEVLDEMARAAGFFWELQGKTLVIRQDDLFIVNVPPVISEDTMAGITNTIQYLGGRDAYLDRAGKTLTFTANRKGMEQIKRYLDTVRENRSLLVYDTHIFQVDLKDGMDTGIQWNEFSKFANNGASRVTTLTAGATGVGLSLKTGTFTLSSLVDFMKTQGTVKSLSRPQITMLSGSKGALRVGKTIKYVSKVGSNTTTGVSQVTTETESLRTGLAIQLQGDIHDQTVFTRVNLGISEVTEMTPFSAVGTQLTLPQTADRDLDVNVRSKPGDVILLGGIHIDSSTASNTRGITGVGESSNRLSSELVLVMKARVVKFTAKPKAQVAEAPAAAVEQGAQVSRGGTTSTASMGTAATVSPERMNTMKKQASAVLSREAAEKSKKD